MIRLSDALILSVTKLRTRRVRLIVTTIVSGLFFIVLTFASFVFTGTTNSIESYSEDGFGKRYIAQVGSYSDVDYAFSNDTDLIAKAKEVDKKLIEDKKAEAKRLGISYDSSTEQLSVIPNSSPELGNKESLMQTPQSTPLIEAYKQEKYRSFFTKLDERLKEYDITGRYYGVMLSGNGTPNADNMTMNPIKNGVELSTSSSFSGQKGFGSIAYGLSAVDAKVLEPFLLNGQNTSVGDDGVVPIVAPFSVAEEALGYTALPSTAKAQEKLDRILDVRSKAAGTKFQVCVRNQTSVDRKQLAEQQQSDETRGKDKKDYVRPELIYDLPEQACGDVVVARDVRSATTKKLDEKQVEFDQKFGKKPAHQRTVTFKIVGITPDQPSYDSGFSVKALVTSILTSTAGNGWFIPMEAKTVLPEYQNTFDKAGKYASYSEQILVEFASAPEAKRFQKTEACSPNYYGSDIQTYCEEKGTPFNVTSYGSNSVAIDDARSWFNKFFAKASLVIALISAVIMMGTIGKVIADSRRETAVFRAIGAKRLDIASVYLLYATQLGLIIVAFALGVAYLLAQWFDMHNSASITLEALTIFNSQDLKREFHLIGFDVMQITRIVIVVIGAALLSSLLPLVNNLKRNPIKDMRDER